MTWLSCSNLARERISYDSCGDGDKMRWDRIMNPFGQEHLPRVECCAPALSRKKKPPLYTIPTRHLPNPTHSITSSSLYPVLFSLIAFFAPFGLTHELRPLLALNSHWLTFILLRHHVHNNQCINPEIPSRPLDDQNHCFYNVRVSPHRCLDALSSQVLNRRPVPL